MYVSNVGKPSGDTVTFKNITKHTGVEPHVHSNVWKYSINPVTFSYMKELTLDSNHA